MKRVLLPLVPIETLNTLSDPALQLQALEKYAEIKFFGQWVIQDEQLEQVLDLFFHLPWPDHRELLLKLTKSMSHVTLFWFLSRMLSRRPAGTLNTRHLAQDILRAFTENKSISTTWWDVLYSYSEVAQKGVDPEALIQLLFSMMPADAWTQVAEIVASKTEKWKVIPQCFLDILQKASDR